MGLVLHDASGPGTVGLVLPDASGPGTVGLVLPDSAARPARNPTKRYTGRNLGCMGTGWQICCPSTSNLSFSIYITKRYFFPKHT